MIYLFCVVVLLLNLLIAMMASTYAEVLEETEGQALKSHAEAIIRMEKSLCFSLKRKIYKGMISMNETMKNNTNNPIEQDTETQTKPFIKTLKSVYVV